MKATELMTGDWVVVNKLDVYGHTFKENIKVSIRDFEFCAYLTFHPIPLTEDILKANGFVRNTLCSGNYYFAPVPDCEIMYHISEDSYEETWHVEVFTDHNDNNYSLFNVCYVHELQHALRLCGLSELADNFKIAMEE